MDKIKAIFRKNWLLIITVLCWVFTIIFSSFKKTQGIGGFLSFVSIVLLIALIIITIKKSKKRKKQPLTISRKSLLQEFNIKLGFHHFLKDRAQNYNNEIKNYLELEKIRFGDKLNVEYDVEYEDFLIPPLTVQPLVENAVIHGIGSKTEGGTIRITSRKLSDDGAQIRVKDNGIGFDIKDISAMDPDEGDIANLRDRLMEDVGGELTITSSPDKGTTSIITIRPNAMSR